MNARPLLSGCSRFTVSDGLALSWLAVLNIQLCMIYPSSHVLEHTNVSHRSRIWSIGHRRIKHEQLIHVVPFARSRSICPARMVLHVVL
jgi:hypothetical protein